MPLCSGVEALHSLTFARCGAFFLSFLSSLAYSLAYLLPISSLTNSRAVLSEFSEGWVNSSVKWRPLPRLSGTQSCKRNSRKRLRCSSGQILLYSVPRCIFKLASVCLCSSALCHVQFVVDHFGIRQHHSFPSVITTTFPDNMTLSTPSPKALVLTFSPISLLRSISTPCTI